MYDQFMRPSMTNRLQDDLKSTMQDYNRDKERLTYQLSHLQTTDHSHTNMSVSSSMFSSNTSVSLTPRKFYRAPNLVAGSGANFKTEQNSNSPDKRWRDRKEQADKIKKEKDLLKLPVIHSASSRRSEWESGKFLQSKHDTFSGIEPLPGINAAKALLAESMKIPSIYDPNRTDTAFDTSKNKKSLKKVTFADENHHGKLHSINQTEASNSSIRKDSKNEGQGSVVPPLNLKGNQFSHVSRPVRPQKTSLLPPLQLDPREVRTNPQRYTEAVNHWKNLYCRILDPEQKTKALSDILNALRLKKYENEQSMKYGNSPRSTEQDELIKQFLSMNATDRIAYKDENGHTRRGLIPTPRSTSVSRLSNGHPNTAQLQNYLRQMSRRHMEALHAQQRSHTSTMITTEQPILTPVSVSG